MSALAAYVTEWDTEEPMVIVEDTNRGGELAHFTATEAREWGHELIRLAEFAETLADQITEAKR